MGLYSCTVSLIYVRLIGGGTIIMEHDNNTTTQAVFKLSLVMTVVLEYFDQMAHF